MSYANISSALTAAQKNDIKARLDDTKLILSFLVNLTPQERHKILKMGDKSVAFVMGVLAALRANPSVVPPAFIVAEFEKDEQLYNDLLFILNLLRPLLEGIEDTMLAIGNELMKQAISGYKLIAEAAKTNSALSSTAKELGKRYERAARPQPSVFSMQPGETMTLHGVVPKRLFKTLSDGTVILYRGASASGAGKTIGGKSKAIIPSGWTIITVVSNEAAAAVIFSVIQK